MSFKLIRGNKGVKDLSDRVFRTVIASKPSEEIGDKNLTRTDRNFNEFEQNPISKMSQMEQSK